MFGWMDSWMDGWMDGWLDGWMDGWVDVFLAPLFSCVGGGLATGRCQVSRSPTKILVKTLKPGKVIQDKNWLVGETVLGETIFSVVTAFSMFRKVDE